MHQTSLVELIPVLQVAIGPVILISGVGLLLLSMTNRLGRVVDRARTLLQEMRGLSIDDRKRLVEQIAILYHRASLIRLSIIMAALSVLLAAVLIIALFIGALMKVESGSPIIAIFIGCMISLIVSLSAFIRDIQLSLHALKLELDYGAEA